MKRHEPEPAKKYWHKYKLIKATAGECHSCARKAEPGRSMCDIHLLQMRKRNRKRKKLYYALTLQWMKNQVKQGLCVSCTSPAIGGHRYCAVHVAKQKQYWSRKQEELRAGHYYARW